MFIEGDKTNYTNSVTRQKISKDELCQGNKILESIFDSIDSDKSGSLEGKEISKLMDKLQKLGEYSGRDDTLEECDFAHAMYEEKHFKKHDTKTIKSFVANFLKINSEKVSIDFDEDAVEFCKKNGYETLDNNNKIIPNKDNKSFKLVYNNNGKCELQNVGEKAGKYYNSGHYEIYYDIKDEKGNVKFKSGFYSPDGKFLGTRGAETSSNPELINEFAKAHGMNGTDCPYLYTNADGVIHHFDRSFRRIDKLIESDENGYLCQMQRKQSQGYVRDFTETIGYYKGKRCNSEAEYYIAKNNLNIEVQQDENGQPKYVDKNNKKRIYKYTGNGQFALTEESITAESKRYKVNGKLDKPIYQKSVGNCYMVSANQGISKYFQSLMADNQIISPEEDPFSLSIPDSDKDKFDADAFTVSLPGIDTNHTLGTKKHYSITRAELQEALNSKGEQSSMGDPDEVLIELAFKKMRTGMIENLIKKYPQFKNEPFRLARIHNNNIGNAKEYYLSPESIQAYIEGNVASEDILTAGTEESVLRAMMPKGTKIETINIPQDKKASEVIEEYRSKNYMILGTYKVGEKEGNHCVLFDNKAGKFISTYDPNSFDPRVLTTEDINQKMICITVVKIPDKKN